MIEATISRLYAWGARERRIRDGGLGYPNRDASCRDYEPRSNVGRQSAPDVDLDHAEVSAAVARLPEQHRIVVSVWYVHGASSMGRAERRLRALADERADVGLPVALTGTSREHVRRYLREAHELVDAMLG